MPTPDDLASQQQFIALLLAKFVRDGLEDMHHRGDLPQSLMPELNTAIRNAIYTGLFVIEQSETDLRYAEYIHRQQRAILTSGWEAPLSGRRSLIPVPVIPTISHNYRRTRTRCRSRQTRWEANNLSRSVLPASRLQ